MISVRLALFAEMMKGKPWTPSSLKEVGGTKGVGVTFLEETFSASTAPPEHRLHQKASQAVLKALLPQSGTDIKGQMRSRQDLLEASGYGNRPRDFDDVIRILDPELRLITPTDPEGSSNEDQQITTSGQYYVLSHDYLVHSLRDWLTRKQRETRQGRAELRLAERSASWNAKPENRHLPSPLEWANIRLLTKNKEWTEPQRRMMKRAGRVHGLRTLGLVMLVSLITWGGIEGYGTLRASALVESLQKVSTPDVPAIVNQLSGYRRWADPRLVRAAQAADDQSRERLHASLALLPVDVSQVDYLFNRLLAASPSEFSVLRDALKTHQSALTPKLWTVLESAKPGDASLLPSASALASYDPGDHKWEAVSGKVSQALVSVNSLLLRPWVEALRPVRGKLTSRLTAIFQEKSRSETVHSLATDILADYASDDPNLIADLLMDADPIAYREFFPIAQRQQSKTLPLLQVEIAKKATISETDRDLEMVRDRLAERQARAAIALLRMGNAGEIFPLLRHSADPRLRSFIVNRLNPLGADPKLIVAELDRIATNAKPMPEPGQQFMDAVLFNPETSQCRALILALGTYGTEGLSPGEREPLTSKLLDLYQNDPDSGIHGAAEWTLRQWKQQEKLKGLDGELMKVKDRGDRRWYVNSQGQTFAVIQGPVEFRMGSPATETERTDENEPTRRMAIPRRFAIAAKEVSVEQFQRFLKLAKITIDGYQLSPSFLNKFSKFSPDPQGPWIGPDWYTAAHYCNWLSEQEGLPKDQWCYLPNEAGEYAEGMTIPADVLLRTGYRMPTEAEWEFACRSGTVTSRYFGSSLELLGKYAWYQSNSKDHSWPCGSLFPNDLGLFDMLGNMCEWCQDGVNASKQARNATHGDLITISESVVEKTPRILRGGAFYYRPAFVRSANRDLLAPSHRFSYGGFRPSRTYP